MVPNKKKDKAGLPISQNQGWFFALILNPMLLFYLYTGRNLLSFLYVAISNDPHISSSISGLFVFGLCLVCMPLILGMDTIVLLAVTVGIGSAITTLYNWIRGAAAENFNDNAELERHERIGKLTMLVSACSACLFYYLAAIKFYTPIIVYIFLPHRSSPLGDL